MAQWKITRVMNIQMQIMQRLGSGACAALPQSRVGVGPSHTKATSTVQSVDTTVIPCAGAGVALWERVWHCESDTGEEGGDYD